MHSCDVLIAPNHRQEGFGLPAAEAMASGLPCVMTAIPSYLSFDETHDYALFAPEQNAVELGERLIELLSDAELRERLRGRGRQVAEQWRVGHAAERLERFFYGRRD
jgi:glycosyltransferase involved in cell wall biosynthesis